MKTLSSILSICILSSCTNPTEVQEPKLYDLETKQLTAGKNSSDLSCGDTVDQDGDYLDLLLRAKDAGQITDQQFENAKSNLLKNLELDKAEENSGDNGE